MTADLIHTKRAFSVTICILGIVSDKKGSYKHAIEM